MGSRLTIYRRECLGLNGELNGDDGSDKVNSSQPSGGN